MSDVGAPRAGEPAGVSHKDRRPRGRERSSRIARLRVCAGIGAHGDGRPDECRPKAAIVPTLRGFVQPKRQRRNGRERNLLRERCRGSALSRHRSPPELRVLTESRAHGHCPDAFRFFSLNRRTSPRALNTPAKGARQHAGPLASRPRGANGALPFEHCVPVGRGYTAAKPFPNYLHFLFSPILSFSFTPTPSCHTGTSRLADGNAVPTQISEGRT